ncbi:MAG: HAD family phosphatase [Pirellulales bacterium]|nr:HAD family phosphatase [Pirellulales bacterium]
MAKDAQRSPFDIRAAVFDLDGLLVNTEELYQDVGTELLSRRGKTFDADLLDAMMGRPQHKALSIMIEWHGLKDTVKTLADETKTIFQTLLSTRLALMPGAKELVEYIQLLDIRLGVATSSGPDFAHDVLSRVGLIHSFHFVLTSADVTAGKPDPEIYHLAAKKAGTQTGNMLVCEDSENGCKAAVASGAITVAVPCGHSLRHAFPGAHIVATSLADPHIYELLNSYADRKILDEA